MKIAVLLIALIPAFAQLPYDPIPNSTGVNAGLEFRGRINANFTYLDTYKAKVGVCSSNQYAIQTTTAGVVCASLTNGQITTGLGFTPAPLSNPTFIGTVHGDAFVGDGSGLTNLPNTGGSGAGSVFTTVTFSATPTYAVSTSAVQVFAITLTGNITSATLNTANATQGQSIVWRYCQDATGGRTVAWPTNVTGYGAVDTTANACSSQSFVWDGTTYATADSGMVSDAGNPALVTNSGVLTLPTGNRTLVGRDTTDTLTGKTISGASNTLTVREADLSTSDVTTGDVSTSKHGFVPKAPNDTSKVFRGDGTWATSTTGNKATLRLSMIANPAAPSTTTHYFGAWSANGTGAPSTTNSTNFRVVVPVSGTIVAASYTIYNAANSTSPSGDTTLSICLNATSGATCNGTSLSVFSGNMTAQFSQTQGVATLSQAVTAGDKLVLDLLPGTFTTNANLTITVDVVIQ